MLQHRGALGDAQVGWPSHTVLLRSDRRPCWSHSVSSANSNRLRSVPIAAAAKLIARFGPINNDNDRSNVRLLAAVDAQAIDFLLTRHWAFTDVQSAPVAETDIHGTPETSVNFQDPAVPSIFRTTYRSRAQARERLATGVFSNRPPQSIACTGEQVILPSDAHAGLRSSNAEGKIGSIGHPHHPCPPPPLMHRSRVSNFFRRCK